MTRTAWALGNTKPASGSFSNRCIRSALRFFALLFLLGPPSLSAQIVGGVVTEAESKQPVAAALVQLLSDSSETVLAVSSTNEQGKFGIPSAAARFRLRVLRIGFRPWTSDAMPASAAKPGQLVLAIPAVPVILSDIAVEAKSQCRVNPNDDQRLASVWDDARTALALLDAQSSQMLEFRSTVTKRMVDPGNHLVSENSMLAFGRGAWPIASLSPDSLALNGFVQAADTIAGPIYYGPDVSVFFSDAFIQTHCFRLKADSSSRSRLIGLSFEPVKDRKVADIEGVLWVSRKDNRLQRLEYRYASLWKWVPKGTAGGKLYFDFLRDGRPILTGWSIRAPVARIESWPEGARVRDESTKPYFGSGKVVLHGFREEVGDVSDVRLGDGKVLWTRPTDSVKRTSLTSESDERP